MSNEKPEPVRPPLPRATSLCLYRCPICPHVVSGRSDKAMAAGILAHWQELHRPDVRLPRREQAIQ